MKIDCIGCLHGFYPELEGGDLLIVTGDLTPCDQLIQYEAFFNWLKEQKYKKKVFICGNHDNQSMSQFDWFDAEYLCDSGTEFDGLKIWGMPHSLVFARMNPKCMAFTGNERYVSQHCDKIPNDVDILVTHMPPFCILDKTKAGKQVGSESLRFHLDSLIKPKLHVFSHIHEASGQLVLKRPGYGVENNTLCVNCSIMNENYEPVNKPVRIIL